MDAEAGQTPFDQRLFLIFMVTFAAMLLFEFSAQFLYPYPPDWRSNLITSLFTSGLAVAIAYFPLNSYYTQSARLLAERKKNRAVEAELRASEEKFRMVVENTLDGIMIAALDGRILYSNQANAHIFEITRGAYEPGSKNIMDVLTPFSREQAQADLKRVAGGIDGFPTEYQAVTATGPADLDRGRGKTGNLPERTRHCHLRQGHHLHENRWNGRFSRETRNSTCFPVSPATISTTSSWCSTVTSNCSR